MKKKKKYDSEYMSVYGKKNTILLLRRLCLRTAGAAVRTRRSHGPPSSPHTADSMPLQRERGSFLNEQFSFNPSGSILLGGSR